MNKGNSSITVIVVAAFAVLCLCLCLALVCFGGIALGIYTTEGGSGLGFTDYATPTPMVIRPTALPTQSASDHIDQKPDYRFIAFYGAGHLMKTKHPVTPWGIQVKNEGIDVYSISLGGFKMNLIRTTIFKRS